MLDRRSRAGLLALLCLAGRLPAAGTAFVQDGKPLAVRQWGKRWTQGDGCLEGSGVGSFLYATQAPQGHDFHVRIRLSIAKLDGTAASFVLGGNHFGFDGRPDHRCFIEGKDFGKTRFVGEPGEFVAAGKPFELEVQRKGETITFRIDGRQVGQQPARGASFRVIGLRPHRATMRVYGFWATGTLQPVRRIDMGDTSDMVLAETVGIQGMDVALASPPKGFRVLEDIGILAHECIGGQVVHRTAEPKIGIYETKATLTPGGDFLLMFPLGKHYGSSKGQKVNDLLACRSSDKGRTWTGPAVGFDIEYNQHGFVPLIPKGSKRIYAFGTQPIPGKWTWKGGQHENAPIGFRWSDDDGHTWSDVTLIEPVNDPGFKGMSVMRMCETDAGTWIIGSHEADWSKKPLQTRQYLLRSEDQGRTWTVLPRPRPGGWFVKGLGRMDEGRPINLGGGRVLALFRTPEGHLWMARSEDDGKTWTDPAPTPLVHPDAPPMIFWHPDGRTLLAFHHNRHSQSRYEGLHGKMEGMKDRSELWVATSTDEGRTWSEPRFLLVNAFAPTLGSSWRNYQCSYIDMVADGNNLHIFMPHRWRQAIHLTLEASDLEKLPTRADLAAAIEAARSPAR